MTEMANPLPIHQEVLNTVRRLCRERADWIFTPAEVVLALPHLNPRSVRAHVVSRCCVNAPKNHPHRWPYFFRVERGRYELLPPYRKERAEERARLARRENRVAEPLGTYEVSRRRRDLRETIHAVIFRDDGGVYVAECLEIATVSQGRTLDEVLANLREAIALHLEGEDAPSLGVSGAPRLVITYETRLPMNGRKA